MTLISKRRSVKTRKSFPLLLFKQVSSFDVSLHLSISYRKKMVWQFLILIMLWSFCFEFPVGYVQGQCLQDQQSSLLRLKENLTFDPDLSSKLISWDSSTDCCSWIGVTCGSNGHVIGLDLSGESISDGIDSSSSSNLFGLQIQSLNLASCNLTRFPGFLKDQVDLFELDLSNNQIGGEIPDWIWSFEYLKSLNLSYNLLVNSQQHLLVRTPLPSTIDLSNNQLQGELPKPPPSAVYVDYSSNNFSSVIPIEFGSYLESAYFVSFSNNNIHGSIPRSICSATSLRVLNLSNNSLNGTIPQCLFGMEYLKVLNLGGNNLSGNISDAFPVNCELQTINFNRNQLEGKIPRSLANCKSLEVLDLGNNRINDVFPSHLEKVSNLRVLVLRSNNLNGRIGCVDNNFSWQVIQIVDLASNHFIGELPVQCFKNWKGMMIDKVDMQDLHLQFFGFYYRDSITVTVKGLETQLVKILTAFTSIDFSCNKFEGEIPEVMGDFKALFGLNLSHNALTGIIPSSIGNLGQLESLDISSNNLSGVIPQELAYLNFLGFLNFSNNQLVGRIPISTQIQSFPNAFQGNDGLCGPPLTKRCGHDRDSCDVRMEENCRVNSRPWSSRDKNSDNGSCIKWNFLSVELGFVFGLGIVILPLMFWRRWRIWYYKHVDVLLSVFFPQLNQRSRNRGSRHS